MGAHAGLAGAAPGALVHPFREPTHLGLDCYKPADDPLPASAAPADHGPPPRQRRARRERSRRLHPWRPPSGSCEPSSDVDVATVSRHLQAARNHLKAVTFDEDQAHVDRWSDARDLGGARHDASGVGGSRRTKSSRRRRGPWMHLPASDLPVAVPRRTARRMG